MKPKTGQMLSESVAISRQRSKVKPLWQNRVPHLLRNRQPRTKVVLAETEQGRGIMVVVHGFSPKGVEGEDDIKWRKGFLRQIGYKL
jgi:hypothetical protein